MKFTRLNRTVLPGLSKPLAILAIGLTTWLMGMGMGLHADARHKGHGAKRVHSYQKVIKTALVKPSETPKPKLTPPPPPALPIIVAQTTIVSLAQGQIKGDVSADSSLIFHSIPFAAPPIGDLRWKPPSDPQAWKGVRYSPQSARACLQLSYGWNEAIAKTSSEDCLYLDVRTPNLSPVSKKPVMVFIHGGANRSGSGASIMNSALASQDIVLVSLQYRLGVLGFMSHPALSAQDEHRASGNYALMDQIKALQWVKANIDKFGGDPDNVTIFGNSAGGQDVNLLMVSPLARGLFSKAIAMSGSAQYGLPARSLEQNEVLGVEIAKGVVALEVAPDSEAALAALRKADGLVLQARGDALILPIENNSRVWQQAVVDNYVLPNAPNSVYLGAQQAKIPMIVGMVASEADLAEGRTAVYRVIRDQFADKSSRALRFYGLDISQNPSADPILGEVSRQVATDVTYRCPLLWTAARQTQLGAKVYVYHLLVAKPDLANLSKLVTHTAEQPFVLDKRPDGVSEAQWPSFMSYWVNFARGGNPNGESVDAKNLAYWHEFGEIGNYAEFSSRGMSNRQDLRKPVCSLLKKP